SIAAKQGRHLPPEGGMGGSQPEIDGESAVVEDLEHDFFAFRPDMETVRQRRHSDLLEGPVRHLDAVRVQTRAFAVEVDLDPDRRCLVTLDSKLPFELGHVYLPNSPVRPGISMPRLCQIASPPVGHPAFASLEDEVLDFCRSRFRGHIPDHCWWTAVVCP